MSDLTICIPTYNRAAYLADTLKSLQQNLVPEKVVDICISDNASSDDTRSVVKHYQELGLPISYQRFECTVSADENMFSVARMARARYGLWLGDDDALSMGGLQEIFDIIEMYSPRFILLRGVLCDGDLINISSPTTRNEENVIFGTARQFFLSHWDKMPFGTPLFDTSYLQSFPFSKYLGTSHLYSAYVYYYLAMGDSVAADNRPIVVTGFPVVRLRNGEKTWTKKRSEVYYREVPRWFKQVCNMPAMRICGTYSYFRYLYRVANPIYLFNVHKNDQGQFDEIGRVVCGFPWLMYKCVSFILRIRRQTNRI